VFKLKKDELRAVIKHKAQMKKAFDMSDLGLLCFYLGVEVRLDASWIALHQTHYAKRFLELSGMTGCNLAHTPMEEKLKLSRESTTEEVDPIHYQG
jgi:cytosine/adenosine deaminase-related metal-dependent hydrolase